MNNTILNINIQNFINNNLSSDIALLLLKGKTLDGVELREIIEQIEAKKKCKIKLPTWFNTAGIYYPNKVNIEQTSSEITAQYKSSLISGDSIIDITGGFGVDCYYLSRQFKKVFHCELNESLTVIATHNFKQLGITNIETITSDGISYLKDSKMQFNWIYADPSRRHSTKGKVFFLKDCLPNIPIHLDMLFRHTNNILIKTSPLLDISSGINELKYVKSIHVIAVNNEVKELLWILEKEYNAKVSIKAVNLKKDSEEHFNFWLNKEESAQAKYNQPLTYLYEPNSAILKASAFNSLATQFNLFKLHKHSHLYTSDELIDFPGRQFKVLKVLQYNKNIIKQESIVKANIATRNFPESVQQIRKKLHIKDGGDTYLFFTTNIKNEKIMLVTHKI